MRGGNVRNLLKVSLLSSVLLVGSSAFAVDDISNMFVGANIGLPITSSVQNIQSVTNGYIIDPSAGWLVGAKFGYRKFLSDNFGFNTYLDYNYMRTVGFENHSTLNQQLILANLDFFYNFNSHFGIYLGLGIGANLLQPYYNAKHEGDVTRAFFAMPFNVGFQFDIDNNNTITFGARLPRIGQTYHSNKISNCGAEIGTYMITLGYTYHFNFETKGWWGMEGYKTYYQPDL